MRKLFGMAMVVGLMAVGGLARDARAGATIDLLFTSKNNVAISATDTVTATAGDTLGMVIVMRTDQQLSIDAFSLAYDLNGDEIDMVGFGQWSGVCLNKACTAKYNPLAALGTITSTFLGSFNSSNNVNSQGLFLPATPGGYQVGTVVWTVKPGVTSDGVDIISGLLNTGVDGVLDNFFNDITALQFNGATVNVVPEPGTAALLGFGLVGLVLAGRRNRA